VQALRDKYEITLAGFNGEHSTDYKLITLTPTPLTFWRKLLASIFLILRLYPVAHRILYAYLPILKDNLKNRTFDLIIANDVETLPISFSLPGKHKVLFDAHEYAPRHFEDKLMWRIFFRSFNVWLCKKYLPLTSSMTTVGKGLAVEYKKHFNVDPIVIPNTNNYFDLKPSPVEENKIRLVHVGIANPSRKLERMIEMMDLVDDRFSLDLYLLIPGFASGATKKYIDDLKDKIKDPSRVKIFPPIKSIEVVKTINAYDMGVFLLPPINFNYKNTLPNKLFDFIQARLGIAIGPTPEMVEIVNHYNIGVVSSDFTPGSLAHVLNSLTAKDVAAFKRNTENAAKKYNAENNAIELNRIVAELIF
jgi:glycosyltransferase involved in cell wall biosynthesis